MEVLKKLCSQRYAATGRASGHGRRFSSFRNLSGHAFQGVLFWFWIYIVAAEIEQAGCWVYRGICCKFDDDLFEMYPFCFVPCDVTRGEAKFPKIMDIEMIECGSHPCTDRFFMLTSGTRCNARDDDGMIIKLRTGLSYCCQFKSCQLQYCQLNFCSANTIGLRAAET